MMILYRLSLRNSQLFFSWFVLLCLSMTQYVPQAQAWNEPDENGELPEEYSTQIFISEPDGSGMKLLTRLFEYQSQGSPEWSQDGKVIAFDAWRPQMGENGRNAQIVVVGSDGANPRVLGDGAMPSLSPEGDRVVYSRYGKGVWTRTVAPEIKEPELLDNRGWGTAWSPDGTRIAYGTFSPPNLVVYNVEEGTRTRLFSDESGPYRLIQWNFTWSPDSKRIAFKGIRKDDTSVLGIVDARGADFGHSTRFVGELLPTITWSPDGKMVLFSANSLDRENQKQLFGLDPDGNGPPRILKNQPDNRWIEDMAYSPDGKKIAVSGHMPNKP